MISAMTVVAPMIFSALSLDSWMPRMFTRQKYTVIAMAMAAEPHSIIVVEIVRPNRAPIRPMTYWPAETPLIGPVRM